MGTLQGVAWIIVASGGASFLILAGMAMLVQCIKSKH